jgi:sugar phosphate isomerase/epimerase
MQRSIATATLYFLPFEQALEIIAEAGFQDIELDLFWERKTWAMAQHLRDVPVRRAVQMVEQAGLRISSIHDGGGVLESSDSITGFINPSLDRYLEAMGYTPDCLVFHTPHIEGDPGVGWWERTSVMIACALEPYRRVGATITIENMPTFDGYFVPMTTPEALHAFVDENELGVTLDTTHYAQIGAGIIDAARKLGKRIRTIHLSDFRAGRTHVFIGEGELDLAGFFETIDKGSLKAVTLECSLSSRDHSDQEMGREALVGRMSEARLRLEHMVC